MIAISYRREDSTPVAGRLHDRLRSEFGRENVFMDFDSIPYGVDFRDHIKRTLERAEVVVAVVGPLWLGHKQDVGRRIDDPNDFVRLEIAGALHRGIPVIPILVDATPMPKPETLPEDVKAFAFRNALVLDTGIDFHHHADRLVAGIRQLLEDAKKLEPPKAEQLAAAKPAAEQVDEDAGAEPESTGPAEDQTAVSDSAPGQQKTLNEGAAKPKRAPRARKPPATAGAIASSRATKRAAPSRPPPLEIEEPAAAEPSRKNLMFIGIGVAAVLLTVVPIVWFTRGRSNGPARVAENVSPSASMSPITTPASPATPPVVAATATPEPSTPAVAAQTSTPVILASAAPGVPPVMPLVPAPIPAVVASIPTAPAPDEDELVRQFVRDYYSALSRHDLNTIVSMFGDYVDFQGQGHHDRAYIRNDTGNYFRRWDRIYFEVGNIIVSRTGYGEFEVKFDFPFSVGQGSAANKRGVSSQRWIVHKNNSGNFEIISQREKVVAAAPVPRRGRHY